MFAFLETVVLIRRLTDHELGALQPLFEAVFKHSVSLELLNWKYAEQRGESWLMETAEGHPALHCGLYFREILLNGSMLRVAQLVDLMAPPKANGLSRRDSPFAVLMHTILADLPRLDNPSGIAFGFPSDRAMKLGEHIGVYRAVDRLMELEFAPRKRIFGPRWRVLSSINKVDAVVLNNLWVKMSNDLAAFALGVRDVRYLQQRYLAHPEKHYELLLIESFWKREPIGLAVIGPGNERRELMDIVCAWKNVQNVISAAQCWLAENSGKVLIFSLTERFARKIGAFAVRCEPTQFRIMGNPFTPSACIESLENRWWLTGGDTDYR